MRAAFYESWNPACLAAPAGAPQGGPFTFNNLPGRPAAVAQACWTLNFDLTGTSSSFDMRADGDGACGHNTDDAFALHLPLSENGKRRAAARAEWYSVMDQPLQVHDVI